MVNICDWFQVTHNAARLRESQLPILFAMTQNDRLVEWQIPVKAAQFCGVEDDNFTWFDSNEKVVRGPSIGWFSRLKLLFAQ
jgi:hypothetical protein